MPPDATFPEPNVEGANIELILWDMGEVLISLDFPKLYGALCPLLGTDIDGLHKALFPTKSFQRFNDGRLSAEGFHQEVQEALEIDVPFEAFSHAWVQFFQPRPGMGQLLESLEGKASMWLLSNTDPLHHRECQRAFPYLSVLDGQLTSYGLGAMKPEPAIYERALAHVQQAPERTLFFDDKPENITGARAQGIHAYLYESEQGCREVLSRYGLLETSP